MEKIYYLDNAATTKVFDEEYDLMKQNNDELFYNPSASYKPAIKAKNKLNEARDSLTKLLGGTNGKLYFTSSATESNNTIFQGVHIRPGQEVLISAGEHPCVYNSSKRLAQKGLIVKEIPLDEFGKVDYEKYLSLLNKNVAFISVIHVSNETGAINDIKKLCSAAKVVNPDVVFHSDGVQAFGKINVNLRDLGVDAYTISAHKIYAPRGIAGLWIKSKVNVYPLLVGGGQEDDFRSSTENVSGAIAFAYAANKVVNELDKNLKFVQNLKNELIFKLKNSKIANFIKINSAENASPYILSVSFPGIKGEVLLGALEADGVFVSTGSACSSKKAGNRILEACGHSLEEIVGSVRISFSAYEEVDLDYVVCSFEKNVLRLEKNVL